MAILLHQATRKNNFVDYPYMNELLVVIETYTEVAIIFNSFSLPFFFIYTKYFDQKAVLTLHIAICLHLVYDLITKFGM